MTFLVYGSIAFLCGVVVGWIAHGWVLAYRWHKSFEKFWKNKDG